MEKNFIIIGRYDNYATSDNKFYNVSTKEEFVNQNYSISYWKELVTNQRGEPVAQAEQYNDWRLVNENCPFMEFETFEEAAKVAENLQIQQDGYPSTPETTYIDAVENEYTFDVD